MARRQPNIVCSSFAQSLGAVHAVAVDGRTLFMDPTVQLTALVQTWHFPSADSHPLDVSWQRYDPNYGGPSVNFTCSKHPATGAALLKMHDMHETSASPTRVLDCLFSWHAEAATYVIWLAYAQQGRPARLSKADDRPVFYTGPTDRVVSKPARHAATCQTPSQRPHLRSPMCMQNPSATGFGGRQFEVSDLASGGIYCLLTSPYHQVQAAPPLTEWPDRRLGAASQCCCFPCRWQ